MNEQERAEFEALKQKQARLQSEFSALTEQLRRFEQRLAAPQPAPAPPVSAKPEAVPEVRLPRAAAAVAAPPIIPAPAALPSAPEPSLKPEPVQMTPPPLPGPISKPAPVRLHLEAARPRPTPPPSAPPPPQAPKPAEALSLEMRLGTFWLVRVGIVLVLGACAFFAKIAYQNYISQLGPGGKVTLLYVASGLLLGAGWWWQRSAVKETLRNYAQVLFAGGLAALYFTTYAAHYIEQLRIIPSPLLDGFLLLGCAGFMVWCADRKKSEVLAMFAVGLAYFTSIITRIGYFTLYSNLVLTLAGVVFLVRNRWAMLTFGSLVATYAAYGFWRFFDGSAWHWASPAEGLWTGVYFLGCYWVLFTTAVFLSRDEKFAGQNRAGFLTLNNGAFFAMFLLTMMQVRQGGFWKFALSYGGVLLVCAEAARRFVRAEAPARNSYLTQGLLLVTVGFISKFSGLQLALVLGMESVVLLMSGRQRQNLVLLAGAYISAGLAAAWALDGIKEMETSGVWLGVGLGGLMLVNALLVGRRPAVEPAGVLRPQSAYFSVLALVLWFAASYSNTSRAAFPLWLAAEAVVLTLSIYALRLPEISLFGQAYLVIAQAAWAFNAVDASPTVPWWNAAVLVVLTLGLSHWWQKQRALAVGGEFGLLLQGIYALTIVGVVYLRLEHECSAPGWLALSGLLALAFTVYGVATRAWFVALFGQIFLGVSAWQFVAQLFQTKPAWYVALVPLAGLALLSGGTVQWFRRKPEADSRVSEPLLQTALLYRWVALAMSLLWVWEYIPERQQIWLLALLGLWAFLWSGLQRNREALWFSAVFTGAALVLFWLPLLRTSTVYWPNLCALVVLLGERQLARRFPERWGIAQQAHTAVIVVGGLSVWLFLSRWVGETDNARYLTASWSLLALVFFGVGIVLRERMYRWLGLGILACALARVVVVDIWKLVALYRVLSLLALGLVLLVLGFIYSKYQEKIREWL